MPAESRDDPSPRRAARSQGHILRVALPKPPWLGYSILYAISVYMIA
jgi:hypothetical protein